MEDWKALIDQAMQIETSDTIGAHGLYEKAVRAALAQSQMLLGDLEALRLLSPSMALWLLTLKPLCYE